MNVTGVVQHSVHHMDISEGVCKCGKFELYTVTPTVAGPTPGNSLKFLHRNFSFQYRLMEESNEGRYKVQGTRYICSLKYSNCILG